MVAQKRNILDYTIKGKFHMSVYKNNNTTQMLDAFISIQTNNVCVDANKYNRLWRMQFKIKWCISVRDKGIAPHCLYAITVEFQLSKNSMFPFFLPRLIAFNDFLLFSSFLFNSLISLHTQMIEKRTNVYKVHKLSKSAPFIEHCNIRKFLVNHAKWIDLHSAKQYMITMYPYRL